MKILNLLLFFLLSLSFSTSSFARRTTCEKCEAFHQYDTKELKPFSPEMQKAMSVLYTFKFSKNKNTKNAQIEEYILYSIQLMKIDQLAMAQEYINQTYRKNKIDFDKVLTDGFPDKKFFLEEVNHAEERIRNGDDGK